MKTKIFGFSVKESQIARTAFLMCALVNIWGAYTYWEIPIHEFSLKFAGKAELPIIFVDMLAMVLEPFSGSYSVSIGFTFFALFFIILFSVDWKVIATSKDSGISIEGKILGYPVTLSQLFSYLFLSLAFFMLTGSCEYFGMPIDDLSSPGRSAPLITLFLILVDIAKPLADNYAISLIFCLYSLFFSWLSSLYSSSKNYMSVG